MTYQINNSSDLIEFISKNNVSIKQAETVISKALKLLIVFSYENKEDLINDLKKHLEAWEDYPHEQPIFLNQNINSFNVKDCFKIVNKCV